MIVLCDPSCGSIRFCVMVGHLSGVIASVMSCCRVSHTLNQIVFKCLRVASRGFQGEARALAKLPIQDLTPSDLINRTDPPALPPPRLPFAVTPCRCLGSCCPFRIGPRKKASRTTSNVTPPASWKVTSPTNGFPTTTSTVAPSPLALSPRAPSLAVPGAIAISDHHSVPSMNALCTQICPTSSKSFPLEYLPWALRHHILPFSLWSSSGSTLPWALDHDFPGISMRRVAAMRSGYVGIGLMILWSFTVLSCLWMGKLFFYPHEIGTTISLSSYLETKHDWILTLACENVRL